MLVPPELFRELRRRNQGNARIASVAPAIPQSFVPRAEEKATRIEVSLPAISPDGQRALVAVKVFTLHGTCPTGYTVALTKVTSGWKVQAHGAFWIV